MSTPMREEKVHNRGEAVAVWTANGADYIGPPIPEMAQKQSPHTHEIIGVSLDNLAEGKHELMWFVADDALDLCGVILSTLAREHASEEDRRRAAAVYRQLGYHFPQSRQEGDDDLMEIPSGGQPEPPKWPRIAR